MLEPARGIRVRGPSRRLNPWIERLWQLAVWLSFAAAIWLCARSVLTTLGGRDIAEVLVLALLTMIRVVVLIALASLIWVPLGVWIGLNPRWA
ncbi:hypothetical protein ABTE96_20105, partial [Acinetobacter baumannii]